MELLANFEILCIFSLFWWRSSVVVLLSTMTTYLTLTEPQVHLPPRHTVLIFPAFRLSFDSGPHN